MEESSISYRRSITDVVKEKDRGKSVHESQAKKSPSTNDASAKKEKKRKTEENATPSSPLNCRKRRSMSSRRYRNLLNEQIEKGDDSDYYPDSDVELEVVEKSMCLRCSKLRRKGNDSHHQFCSCGSKELTAFSGDPLALQMKIACSGETIQRDDSYDLCVKCKQFGSLMHCGGKDCMKSYHPSCLYPPLSDVRFGIWICFCCFRRKMEFGVHSVSQGIESILDSKDDMQDKWHYFVKFKGLAHFYNRWIPMSQMLIEDPVLLTKFNKKQRRGQENIWKHDWTEPHRLLQRRFLVPPEQIDVCSCGHGDNIEYCYVEWLVKWKGLGYEHATWEFENSIFLCSANGKALIDEFERRRAEAKELNLSHINKDLCVEENHLYKLLKLVDKFPAELNNELLISVSNIIKRWHKNQNAILIDDQEANIKSILSISRLVSYTCRPFLIISTVPSLSTWEAEFTRLVPSINTVVYSGNKVVREMIRSLEFYEEGGCIMFNVLIASPEVIVEDLEYLNCLGWEGIVIDDCQKTRVSKHFDQFAILSSEFRLIILNSIPKETVTDYYKLLSFLDLKGQSSPHSSKSDSSENDNELSILKKRLKRYIVHKGRELLEEANVEAPDVTSLQDALNSNQPDFITDADNPAKSLHGSEAALSPDAIIPKESVGTDRDHARTDNSSPQSAHAHGAQGPVDNISDCQQESANIGTVIEHTHCEEERELDISQVEHTDNPYPESENAHISPGSENALISPGSEHAHVNAFSEHAHISPLSEHAHSSPGSEHALVNPGSEHAHINCESVACSGLGRVPPVSNSVPETVRVNNPTTSTSQQEFSDFLQQLFAASHSFPRQEVKSDPFENDLNMMRHWEFSISHSHQKKKLALAEECEKEMEQVRKKYTLMVQNEATVCNQRLMVMKKLRNTLQKSQILAELFRSNLVENNSHGNLEENQGEPSQPTPSLVKSPNPTIFPRNITSQGGPSQPTQSLVQSPKPTISPRNLTSQGGPSQPTPPLIRSPKPTKSSRNLTTQGEWSQLTPPLVQPPKPTISPRK